ncbi:MAG: fumarate hydratase [Candidatus Izemoplasma sp.]
MRNIDLTEVTKVVKESVIKINYNLDNTLVSLIRKAKLKETKELSKSILDDILENQDIAKAGHVPLCQDTGMVVVYLEIGREVIINGDIYQAINEGVREGYDEGYLRKSVVSHPFTRTNTKDNTPAIIHTLIVPGDKIKMKIASKGAGSENMSKVTMLIPTDGISGVTQLVLNTILEAGGRPCPPLIIGIGIGGNLEKSALIAKEALLRDLNDEAKDPIINKLEKDLLIAINKLDVGPMGVGGVTTCLAVKINYYPMHIAALPVAINIQCHSSRHTEVII